MSLNNIIRNTGKINVQSKINTNKYKKKNKKTFIYLCIFPGLLGTSRGNLIAPSPYRKPLIRT